MSFVEQELQPKKLDMTEEKWLDYELKEWISAVKYSCKQANDAGRRFVQGYIRNVIDWDPVSIITDCDKWSIPYQRLDRDVVTYDSFVKLKARLEQSLRELGFTQFRVKIKTGVVESIETVQGFWGGVSRIKKTHPGACLYVYLQW